MAHNAAEDVLLEELALGAVHGHHIPASQHLGRVELPPALAYTHTYRHDDKINKGVKAYGHHVPSSQDLSQDELPLSLPYTHTHIYRRNDQIYEDMKAHDHHVPASQHVGQVELPPALTCTQAQIQSSERCYDESAMPKYFCEHLG